MVPTSPGPFTGYASPQLLIAPSFTAQEDADGGDSGEHVPMPQAHMSTREHENTRTRGSYRAEVYLVVGPLFRP